jgi:RND family efflux transporter MFP subunit
MTMAARTFDIAHVTSRIFLQAPVLAVCALLLSACGGGDTTPAAAAVAPARARDTAYLSADAMGVSGVSLVESKRIAWRDVWQLPARLVLDPTTTQALGSIVEGRVTLVLAQPGDRVARGQVLVTIHSHELTSARNELAQATAGKTETENSVQIAATALARAERLYAAQAGSLAELERARAAQVAALAGQRRAASEFDRATEMVHHLQPPGAMRAGIDPEDVLVRAPFGGVLVAREAQPGAVVLPGATLVTVSRTGWILLAMRVPEAALGAAKIGSDVQFTVPAFPGRAFNGRVTRVAPMLDSLSRTAEVFAAVENRGGELRGEMTAAAEVFGPGRDSAVAVPVSAIQDFEGDTVVVVGTKRSGGLLLEAMRVRVGRRAAGMAEIKSGLAAGVSVIHDGAAVAKAEILRQRDARAPGGEPQ